jgi:hypothetical protein
MVDDEALVLEWAKREMPTIVQMIERVPKSDLNDLLKSTGEMPDAGAHIEPAAERFFIK